MLLNKFFTLKEEYENIELDKKYKYIFQDRDGYVFACTTKPMIHEGDVEWVSSTPGKGKFILVYKNLTGPYNHDWKKAVQKLSRIENALDKILEE